MRFILYGAGAVGGTIGARLFQAGHSVVLIARGPHLEAIQKDGLLFEAPGERERLAITAVGHPSALRFGPEDVVLLTMKSQHTQDALLALADAAGEDVPVVCAQNGVANEVQASRRFSRVYGMVVMLPATHLEPGSVQAQSRARTGLLDVGMYPRGTDALCEELAQALEGARMSSRPDPAILRLKYAKLLNNLGNAVQACYAPSEASATLLRRARHEALACFGAAGIDCATREEFARRRGDTIQPAPIEGKSRSGGSTWQSLRREQGSVEVDYLNGEIVLLGRQHGIATPINRALQLATHEACRAGTPPGTLDAGALLATLPDPPHNP